MSTFLREGGPEGERGPKQVPHTQHRDRWGAQSHNPEVMTPTNIKGRTEPPRPPDHMSTLKAEFSPADGRRRSQVDGKLGKDLLQH